MENNSGPADVGADELEAAAVAQAAALAEAARDREERRREADRNDIFNDVYKSTEDTRSEWIIEARKQRIWLIVFAMTALIGLALPVFWAVSLIAAIGTAMTWESTRERKRAYKRALFESDLERKILAHEAGAGVQVSALGANEPPGEIG